MLKLFGTEGIAMLHFKYSIVRPKVKHSFPVAIYYKGKLK